MSAKLDRKTTQLVMATALRHGVSKASILLANRGLSYSRARIYAMFKNREQLSTVLISSEIEKCNNFTDYQNIFKKQIG